MLNAVRMLAARPTPTPVPGVVQVADDLKTTVTTAAKDASSLMNRFPWFLSRMLI